MSELPPYTPYDVAHAGPSKASTTVDPSPPSSLSKSCLAGPMHTCSLSDMQYDYFKITRTSPISYSINLTTDPTPLYYLEVNPESDPSIQLFDPSNPVPLAAARLPPFVTVAAKICTRDPTSEYAQWRSITTTSVLYNNRDYHCFGALEPIPGLPAVERTFIWKHGHWPKDTVVQCRLEQPLMSEFAPNPTLAERDLVVARYGFQGQGFVAPDVLEVRRGGGLEFELGLVVQAFAVMELEKRKKGKKK